MLRLNLETIIQPLNRTLLALLCIITAANEALSQDTLWIFRYPSAANVKVMVDCTISKEMQAFRYSYGLRSSTSSQQDVEGFFLDVNSLIKTISSPDLWRGTRSATRQAVMWFSRDSTKDILPGQNLDGFRILCNGLPGIATFYVEGFVPVPEFPYGQTPDSVIGNDVFENSFKGKTLAPKDPPVHFVHLAFLDTLISYKHQAYNLGWITNKGILNSLDQKLDNARKQLERGNNKAAKNVLEAFIDEVEAQKGKHLSSEAYALLKFNAEYLISKLE